MDIRCVVVQKCSYAPAQMYESTAWLDVLAQQLIDMYVHTMYIGHVYVQAHENQDLQHSGRSPYQDDSVVCEKPQFGYKQLQTPEV